MEESGPPMREKAMQKKTRVYTKELKPEAVQLVQTGGKSQAQIYYAPDFRKAYRAEV